MSLSIQKRWNFSSPFKCTIRYSHFKANVQWRRRKFGEYCDKNVGWGAWRVLSRSRSILCKVLLDFEHTQFGTPRDLGYNCLKVGVCSSDTVDEY